MEVESYRPICLLSVVGKLFERVISAKLEHIFRRAISDRQFGFMPDRSTMDAMTLVRREVLARPVRIAWGCFLISKGPLTGCGGREFFCVSMPWVCGGMAIGSSAIIFGAGGRTWSMLGARWGRR